MDTVAVTVTRTSTTLARVPAAISVVSKERIQAGRLGLTLDEALNDVPGVLVNNRYNFALGTRISVRGLGARAAFGVRGVRLLADGIPLTMPDGQASLNNIDLTSTGRIEVLRGAASMLHGNAAGGVIELSTETPAPGFAMEARGIAAHLGYGGFGDLARFNIKAGGGSERVRYVISGAHATGDGARDHSAFEQTNVTARLEHFTTGSARTALTLSLADAPIAENPGSLPRDSVERDPEMAWPRNVATSAGEKSRQLQAGIRHQRRIANHDFGVTVYGLTRTLDNPLPFAYITLDRRAGGTRATFGNERIAFGVDVEMQSDERGEFVNNNGNAGAQRRDQTDRVFTVGPFVRALLPITQSSDLTLGARYDRAHFEVEDRFTSDGRDDSGSRTLAAFSPMAGVTYRLSDERTLFANISTSFQTPTTTEMINRPPLGNTEPCCPAGFNDVDPERATSVEAGFRGRVGSRVRLDAAAYHMRVRDAITAFQVAQVEGREFFRNAGRTRHTGLELSTTALVTPVLSLTTSYTYSNFTFEAGGKQLPGVPPHHALLRAVLRTRHLTVEPEAEHTAGYYANDANSEAARNRAATVYNLRLRLRAGGIEPFLIISNLTSERYSSSVVINAAGGRYFEPAPGRGVFLGLSTTRVFR